MGRVVVKVSLARAIGTMLVLMLVVLFAARDVRRVFTEAGYAELRAEVLEPGYVHGRGAPLLALRKEAYVEYGSNGARVYEVGFAGIFAGICLLTGFVLFRTLDKPAFELSRDGVGVWRWAWGWTAFQLPPGTRVEVASGRLIFSQPGVVTKASSCRRIGQPLTQVYVGTLWAEGGRQGVIEALEDFVVGKGAETNSAVGA